MSFIFDIYHLSMKVQVSLAPSTNFKACPKSNNG